MQLLSEQSQDDPSRLPPKKYCVEFDRKLQKSKCLCFFWGCFLVCIVMAVILGIFYFIMNSNLSSYQSNNFVVYNYTLDLSTCDLDSGTVICYLGYIDINYRSVYCQKYIQKTLMDKNELLAYLMKQYPKGTVMEVYYKDNNCNYDFLDKQQKITGTLIASIVFAGLAFLTLWPFIYFYHKA